MSERVGRASIRLEEPVYITESASIVGKKEGEGPLGLLFDVVGEDDLFGCTSWEEAESVLQKQAVSLALEKAGLKAEEVNLLFAGDLLGQSIASSFGVSAFRIPHFGLYGACSTCGEGLALGAMAIAGNYAEKAVCVTSSHFASAEKEFRFPLDYGNQRPLSATWTVTGGGAFVLSRQADRKKAEKNNICYYGDTTNASVGKNTQMSVGARARISGMTIGIITDFGLKDSMNMGACMAPASASTLERHFIDFGSQPSDYDRIITGDLGSVGQKILIDMMQKKGYDISAQHMDCGIEIFDAQAQDTHSGGSGCGCSAVTLSAYILKQLEEKNWKRVLFMPTGALLSKTSFNEGKSVPAIAHALILEAC
ncbi:MAG: stage V sporulation protein AD [Lachnospiraceae bacterium]|nr:stage V sporulation protein AD [Lachnospiraceae bacterium]MBQ8118265.1 stage V sporulation protein AD [Lachnospiraceae bacterium]